MLLNSTLNTCCLAPWVSAKCTNPLLPSLCHYVLSEHQHRMTSICLSSRKPPQHQRPQLCAQRHLYRFNKSYDLKYHHGSMIDLKGLIHCQAPPQTRPKRQPDSFYLLHIKSEQAVKTLYPHPRFGSQGQEEDSSSSKQRVYFITIAKCHCVSRCRNLYQTIPSEEILPKQIKSLRGAASGLFRVCASEIHGRCVSAKGPRSGRDIAPPSCSKSSLRQPGFLRASDPGSMGRKQSLSAPPQPS